MQDSIKTQTHDKCGTTFRELAGGRWNYQTQFSQQHSDTRSEDTGGVVGDTRDPALNIFSEHRVRWVLNMFYS